MKLSLAAMAVAALAESVKAAEARLDARLDEVIGEYRAGDDAGAVEKDRF